MLVCHRHSSISPHPPLEGHGGVEGEEGTSTQEESQGKDYQVGCHQERQTHGTAHEKREQRRWRLFLAVKGGGGGGWTFSILSLLVRIDQTRPT